MTTYRFFTYTLYLRLFLEAHFFLTIAVFVEFRNEHETITEIISLLFAISAFMFLMSFTAFTIWHYVFYRNDPSIVNGSFKVLYEGLKGNWVAKLYSTFFLVRRFILALFLVFVRVPIAQITILIGVQLSALLYLMVVRPFSHVHDNIINLINEICIFTVCWIFLTLRNGTDIR
jgi:hypothetical protein